MRIREIKEIREFNEFKEITNFSNVPTTITNIPKLSCACATNPILPIDPPPSCLRLRFEIL